MEAIIAAFLLLTSMLVVAALVDTSLQTQAKAEQYLVASMVAANELDRLRGYATRYGMAQLDVFDGRRFESESDSVFKVHLSVKPHLLFLPNTSLETHHPEDSRKAFRNSARLIQVRVAWSEHAADAVDLFSIISDWRESDFEIEISADGALELSPNERLNLTASSGGVQDLVYTWYTEPLTGLGSIDEVSRDGKSAVYINRYRTPGNRFEHYDGVCRVVARAQYRNIVKTGEIEVVNVP